MTEQDDTIRSLAALIWAVVYDDHSATRRAEALLPRLGIGGNDSAAAWVIEAGLRQALGLPREAAAPTLAARVTAVLAAAGFTDSRDVFPGAFLVTGTGGSVTVSTPWVNGDDADRGRLLKMLSRALTEGGLYVRERDCWLQVHPQSWEASGGA